MKDEPRLRSLPGFQDELPEEMLPGAALPGPVKEVPADPAGMAAFQGHTGMPEKEEGKKMIQIRRCLNCLHYRNDRCMSPDSYNTGVAPDDWCMEWKERRIEYIVKEVRTAAGEETAAGTPMERVGALLRRYRKAAGLTQEEAADMIGKTKSAVSKYEKGLIAPGGHMIIRFAQAYKVKAPDLAYQIYEILEEKNG